jgi:hypothetical protein
LQRFGLLIVKWIPFKHHVPPPPHTHTHTLAAYAGVVTDSSTTQAAIATLYAPSGPSESTVVFGSWESEVHDVAWLSSFGLPMVNSGRHLSLLSLFVDDPPVPIPPQPTLPQASLPKADDSSIQAFVAFSFSQGDAASFNQVGAHPRSQVATLCTFDKTLSTTSIVTDVAFRA